MHDPILSAYDLFLADTRAQKRRKTGRFGATPVRWDPPAYWRGLR